MKTVLKVIGGAVGGYLVVALTVGFFLDRGILLALLYVAGMIVGAVMAARYKTAPEG